LVETRSRYVRLFLNVYRVYVVSSKVLLVAERRIGYTSHNHSHIVYSCFEKGCPAKPYATMPRGIRGNVDSWSLIEALVVSAI